MAETPPAPRLFVVDDDPAILRLVTLSMKGRGYEVDAVTDLDGAVAKIQSTTYDVVLTDKNLKGATGLELIDALVLFAPSTAIVLMTAYPEGAVGRLASLDGYLGKPFKSLEVLAQTLEDARDHKKRTIERQQLMGKLGEVQVALTTAAPGRSR
jgi:two-component system response regulator GlrR